MEVILVPWSIYPRLHSGVVQVECKHLKQKPQHLWLAAQQVGHGYECIKDRPEGNGK